MERKEIDKNYLENSTKFGEVIPTNFSWTSPEDQKERVSRLEKIGKNKKNTKTKKEEKMKNIK